MMRRIFSIVLLFSLLSLTMFAQKHEYKNVSEYDDSATRYDDTLIMDEDVVVDSIWEGDSIICDTVTDDDVISGITTDDVNTFSPLGESSASLYAGKQFCFTNQFGSEFDFIVNADGVSVTLESGDAHGVPKLVIPYAVDELGSYFFVTDIAHGAFETFFKSPMKGVKELEISEGIQNVGGYCFKNAPDLERVTLPASLKNISYQMFASCTNLKHIVIPESSNLSEIDSFAFQDCINLSNFNIPGAVSSVGSAPWMGCASLDKIVLDEDNYSLVEADGVLYSDWQGNLIQYPAGKKDKEYHPLFGTITIDEQAFYGNPFIEKVIFPASLDSLSYYSFGNCPSLRDVTFNSTDVFIDRGAFNDCPQLKEIALYGTPNYAVREGQSKSFDSDAKIIIAKELPPIKLPKSEAGVLTSVWDYVSLMPYFYVEEDDVNNKVGFPKSFGKGKAAISGNAGPKPDVLRVLASIPSSYLAFEHIDEKGHIRRIYLDKSDKKSPRVLYFKGGIGGNDLVVALFVNGNLKKIEKMIVDIKQDKYGK